MKNIPYFCIRKQELLSYGVMVTQQSLDLFFLVRVRVAQQVRKAGFHNRPSYFPDIFQSLGLIFIFRSALRIFALPTINTESSHMQDSIQDE